MKDPHQVLSQKERDIERVRKEIQALRFVIPLLAEDADRIELGLAVPRSQFRENGIATANGWTPWEPPPTRGFS
jgi:hypothetical protein